VSDNLDYDEINASGFGLGVTARAANHSGSHTNTRSFAHVAFNPTTRNINIRADVHDPVSLVQQPLTYKQFDITPHLSASCNRFGGHLSTSVWMTERASITSMAGNSHFYGSQASEGEGDTGKGGTGGPVRSVWTNLVFLTEQSVQAQKFENAVRFFIFPANPKKSKKIICLDIKLRGIK
jgi:hypothetical protein